MNETDLLEIAGWLLVAFVSGYSFGLLILYFRKFIDLL